MPVTRYLVALALASSPLAAIPQSASQPASCALQPPACTFDAGLTTCVYVARCTEISYHTEVSGCLYGPLGVPSRRERTFEDTDLVTVTTTTFAHGRSGPVYDYTTDVSRERSSSVLISDVCLPP